MMLHFKYGFYYKDRLHVWHEKKLYRYPFNNGKMYFGLKEIEPKKNNHYRICRDWVGLNKIKALTAIIKVDPVPIFKDKDIP